MANIDFDAWRRVHYFLCIVPSFDLMIAKLKSNHRITWVDKQLLIDFYRVLGVAGTMAFVMFVGKSELVDKT